MGFEVFKSTNTDRRLPFISIPPNQPADWKSNCHISTAAVRKYNIPECGYLELQIDRERQLIGLIFKDTRDANTCRYNSKASTGHHFPSSALIRFLNLKERTRFEVIDVDGMPCIKYEEPTP